MNMKTIPPFSVVIAPSYLHPMIQERILQDRDGCIGIRLHTISSYLNSLSTQESPDQMTLMFTYRDVVDKVSPPLHVYHTIVKTPAFLEECHQLIEWMKAEVVLPNELPDQTEAEKEIKNIVTALYAVKTSQDIYTAIANEMPTCKQVVILEAFYTEQERCMLRYFLKKGAKYEPLAELQPNKLFFHAVNKRQEIEACAQKIIQQNLLADDCMITLADGSYKAILEQVFQRYEIPYTILQQEKTSIVVQRFVSLLKYVLYDDEELLSSCIETGVFNMDGLEDLQRYRNIFHQPLHTSFQHLQQLSIYGHILNKTEIQKLQELEIRAEKTRCVLHDILATLHSQDIQQLIMQMMNMLQQSLQHADAQDIQVLKQLQDLVSQSFPFLKTKDDLEFLLPFIEKISLSCSIQQLQGIIIADLPQVVIGRTHHFLLGATQKNYPGFPSKSGIFDESYIQKTPLTSMEERYQQYMQLCQKKLHSSDTLLVSYPLGTYEGKGNEAALEIEEEMQCRSTFYPLIENYERWESTKTIAKKTANRLFVKDHRIQGSISAVERYIHCPYSYFLRYGLALREPMQYGFTNSYMGTLMHYVLETLVEQFGKAYADTNQKLIQAIVEDEIQAIRSVFPNHANQLQVVKQRFLLNMKQTLERLQEFESHSALKPVKKEYEFHYTFPIDDAVSFDLKGYIDRIDASAGCHCILDYKSSSKTLSEDRVYAALQLQLLTYAIVVKESLGKEILGAYYVSLKNENIPYIAGKMKRRPVEFIESDHEQYQEEIIKAHKLHGWTMRKEVELLDDTGTHISGVSYNKKDGRVKARKYYQYTTIASLFQQLYQKIGSRILCGNIALQPDEEACLYCSYHEICRFKGFPTDRKPLVEKDEDTIYWEGGEVDANME